MLLLNKLLKQWLKLLKLSIVDGVGTASPKGILKETPNAGQALDVSTLTYAGLVEAEGCNPTGL